MFDPTKGCILCRRPGRQASGKGLRSSWVAPVLVGGATMFTIVLVSFYRWSTEHRRGSEPESGAFKAPVQQEPAPAPTRSSTADVSRDPATPGVPMTNPRAQDIAVPPPRVSRESTLAKARLAPGMVLLPHAPSVGAAITGACLSRTSLENVRYNWSSRDSFGRVTPLATGQLLTWTPTEAGRVLLQCELQVPDGPVALVTHGVSVRKPAIRRYLDNRPPVLGPPNCESAQAGRVSCSVEATDPDGDRVSVDWVSTGGGTRSGAAVELPVLSATADGGVIETIVLVRASDRRGGEAHASVRVKVPTSACGLASPHSVRTLAWTMPDRLRATEKLPSTTAREGCFQQIMACKTQHANFDECVKSAVQCNANQPLGADPAGIGCCPTPCVEAYFALRQFECAEEAVLNLRLMECYPSDASPQPQQP